MFKAGAKLGPGKGVGLAPGRPTSSLGWMLLPLLWERARGRRSKHLPASHNQYLSLSETDKKPRIDLMKRVHWFPKLG